MRNRLMSSRLFLGICVLMTAGCVSSPPTHWYLLSSQSLVPVGERHEPAHSEFVIGIGPITIPEYLNRPQIVTRAGEHEVELAEFHKWAEPLDTSLVRVLADNLTQRLPAIQVVRFPWKRSLPVGYHFTGEIIRFDSSTLKERVELVARWQLVDETNNRLLIWKTSQVTVPVSASGHAAIVSAMSDALRDLSEEMALEIRHLPAPASAP